ncbi:MAG: S8 family serine peptidase [bacterium]|nr:S8 family serine peptidase [bacterium]
MNRVLGITGQGVLIGILDTGVDGSHPALAARWRGNFALASECWLDVVGTNPDFPVDSNSHGTHVMGTMCGREIDGNGDTITVGSAPDAQWIACNAIDQSTSGDLNNDIIDAFQWFANPDGNSATLDDVPDVVQNSWGVNEDLAGYTECWDLWNTVIVNLEALGVVVTFSAGNEASEGLRSPAIHELSEVQMFAVGAVDAQANAEPPYAIARFSSLGPSPCDGTHIKPELVAPGVNINSSVPGGGYSGSFSGTSMAGPHVAGIVALMRQACPHCDPITIKQALLNTAIDDGYGPLGNDNTFGYGFIDGFAAVQAVSTLGYLTGTVTCDGAPLPDVAVTLLDTDNDDVTAADGGFSLPVLGGTYTLRFRRFGYTTLSVNGIVITGGDTTFVEQSLELAPLVNITGHICDSNGQPVSDAAVEVLNAPVASVNGDGEGVFDLEVPAGETYVLQALGAQGAARRTLFASSDATADFFLPTQLMCFDFEASEQAWTRDSTLNTAQRGNWNRMDPQETVSLSGTVVQPADDHTLAPGINCFVTDGRAGTGVGDYDVDNGRTVLLSPIWSLSAEYNVVLEFYTWFSNDNGVNPGEDFFDIELTGDGVTWVPVVHESDDWELWRRHTIFVEDYVGLSNSVRMRVTASDLGNGSLVEAALDDVCLYATSVNAPQELTAQIVEAGIQLHWKSVPGAISYTVRRGMQYPPTLENCGIISTISGTEYLDTTSLDSIGYYIVTANHQ